MVVETGAGSVTSTYGVEAKEAAEHRAIHRPPPPPTNNDLAQKVNSPEFEEHYCRLFKFPSPDGQK